ncbi:hypothetical protein HDU67_009225 [Dinochytrium kinnereticum]|nr:hypothetical protein HDU67_009225 [Dinochytrium kinnereticum]
MSAILPVDELHHAATIARGLAMDAVTACKSGHLGLPLGCADVGAALFGSLLSYNPKDAKWVNRDRMFLYSWLHLANYNVSLDEVKSFRKLHSITPGHPEFGETDGVEATTGPLGTGISSAVGIAVAQKMTEAKFNTEQHKIFDARVVVLAGDGCLQEGVSHEACSFAAHEGLDNLIVIYDANEVTLDAMASKTQSEDTAARYRAYGWDVCQVGGHDIQAFADAYRAARSNLNSRPKMIIIKTIIGYGISEVAGTNKAHGEAGVKFVVESKQKLGIPANTNFYVSDRVKTFFGKRTDELIAAYDAWNVKYAAWKSANPSLATLLEDGVKFYVPPREELLKAIPVFADAEIATRKAGEACLQPLAQAMPLLLSGSADLHGSTLNYIKGVGDFSRENRAGRNLYYGIREFGMGCIVNGIGYHGLWRGSGATFFTFSDFLRPAIRLAALAKLPIFHIFTHDSVGVGEDGPTHQPVETLSACRAIPNLDVIRPADPEETAGAFVAAVERVDGPTILVLSRQNLPYMKFVTPEFRREGVFKGGYVLIKETAPLKHILMASGSEVQHAVAAAATLGPSTRVVSFPSFFRFDQQPQSYKDEVLPPTVRARVAIEAGVGMSWWKYVGLDGKVVGIERFGLSAPGGIVMKELGITAEGVLEAVKGLGV